MFPWYHHGWAFTNFHGASMGLYRTPRSLPLCFHGDSMAPRWSSMFRDTSMGSDGAPMVVHDVFRDSGGAPMVLPCWFHGAPMVIPWGYYRLACMAPLWCFHGAFMALPWCFHGVFTVYSWRFHGSFYRLYALPSCFHGASFVLPWDFRGSPCIAAMYCFRVDFVVLSWTPMVLL